MFISVKKHLRKTLDAILEPLGYRRISPKKPALKETSLLAIFFGTISQMGFEPKHIIDIGANRGNWTRQTLNYYPNAFYTLLEPQADLYPAFQDILDSNPNVRVQTKGAGSETGSFMFTLVNRDDSCSFRYTKEEADKAGFKQIEIPVVTLNELVDSLKHLPFPDIVKIDAEGMDLEVLKGASTLFGKTEVFLVEASVNSKLFDNTFLDMINFMAKQGYVLFDITDLNRPFEPNILWLVELAFIKKGGVLDGYEVAFEL